MSQQWKMTMDLGNNLAPIRSSSVFIPTGSPVLLLADEIGVFIGDNVGINRQNEITQAWKWLYQGVRSRNLLDDQFVSNPLISGSHIDFLTEADRRTSSTPGDFTEDDVSIGIGAGVTSFSETLIIEEAFRLLIQFALETTLKSS